MSNFRISTKIAVVLLILGGVAAIIATVGVVGLQVLSLSSQRAALALSETAQGARMNRDLTIMNRAEYSLIAIPSEHEDVRAMIATAAADFDVRLQSLIATADSEQRPMLVSIE